MSAGRPARRPVVGRITGGLVACLVAAGVLAGCSTVRSDLGTSDSPCYLALPAASQAVHGSGKLAGVDLLTLTGLRRQAPHLFAPLAIPHPGPDRICVIEFTGSFAASSVARPLGSPSGRLAVVVLRTPSNRLLGTVILDHPPLHFGHAHIG
jgi:hypothetical protein